MGKIKGWFVYYDKPNNKTWSTNDGKYLIVSNTNIIVKNGKEVRPWDVIFRDDPNKIYEVVFSSNNKNKSLAFASDFMKKNIPNINKEDVGKWKKVVSKNSQEQWVNKLKLTILNVYNSKGTRMDDSKYNVWNIFIRERRYESDESGKTKLKQFNTKEEALDYAKKYMRSHPNG